MEIDGCHGEADRLKRESRGSGRKKLTALRKIEAKEEVNRREKKTDELNEKLVAFGKIYVQ